MSRIVKVITSCGQERIQAVEEAVSRTKRLIGWLTFFRIKSDRGIGDTAQRLMLRACKSPDAVEQLTRLLKKCSCKIDDAIEKLNTEHPY